MWATLPQKDLSWNSCTWLRSEHISENFVFTAYWSAFAAWLPHSFLPIKPSRPTKHHLSVLGSTIWKETPWEECFFNASSPPPPLHSFNLFALVSLASPDPKGDEKQPSQQDVMRSAPNFSVPTYFRRPFFFQNQRKLNSWDLLPDTSQNTSTFTLDAKMKCDQVQNSKRIYNAGGKLNHVQGLI